MIADNLLQLILTDVFKEIMFSCFHKSEKVGGRLTGAFAFEKERFSCFPEVSYKAGGIKKERKTSDSLEKHTIHNSFIEITWKVEEE